MRYLKDEIGFCELPNIPTLNVYAIGCKRECNGCHLTYLKDFNYPNAKVLTNDTFLNKVNYGLPLVRGVVWLGGDPIYQSERVIELSNVLIDHNIHIMNCMYTGELFENISEDLKSVLTVIKDGEWKGIPVTSDESNQRFFVKNDGVWNQVKYSELTKKLNKRNEED